MADRPRDDVVVRLEVVAVRLAELAGQNGREVAADRRLLCDHERLRHAHQDSADGRHFCARVSITFYYFVGIVSWPLRLLYRLSSTGRDRLPPEGGFVLASNHISALDPWALGYPLWPQRHLRWMAKVELFENRIVKAILDAGGAFPVRRGASDQQAIQMAVEVLHDGDVLVMFPEGTRRRDGRPPPRPHSGAARLALSAGVPLVPGSARRHRPAAGPGALARGVRGAGRGRRPGRRRPAARRRRGHRAPDGGDHEARGLDRVTALRQALMAVDGDSLAHRAYHALPKTFRRADDRPAGALIGFTDMLVGLWDQEQPRAVVVAWDTLEVPTYRHEAYPSYQSGRVFDAELLEQLAILPELVRSLGFVVRRRRPATRRTTSSPRRPGPRRRAAARRSSSPPTATLSSWRASGRRS